MKPAFTKDDRIVLHFNLTHDGTLERKYSEHISTHKFGAKYAAKKFIDAVIGDYDTKWVSSHRLLVNRWFSITVDELAPTTLEKIMEYEYDKDEKKWELPHPYPNYAESIRAFRKGVHPDINTHDRRSRGLPPISDDEAEKLKLRQKPRGDRTAPSRAKPEKPLGKSPKRAPASDTIALAQICQSIKVDPREARRALREAKVPKPASGWQWPISDTDTVTKTVNKAIEKLRSKK